MWTNQPCERFASRVDDSLDFKPSRLKIQYGVVTTEFIFSFIIAAGISVVLFTLTYTLLVVETLQYVSYSVARAHLASNITPQKQMEAGQKKYTALTQGDSAIARIFKSSWFEIGAADEIIFRQGQSADGTGGPKDFSGDLGGGGENINMRYQGVSVRFLPRILNFKLLSLGSTNPDGDDSVFETRINTMLIRESSQQECRQFYKARTQSNVWQNLVENSSLTIVPSEFSLAEDNGC